MVRYIFLSFQFGSLSENKSTILLQTSSTIGANFGQQGHVYSSNGPQPSQAIPPDQDFVDTDTSNAPTQPEQARSLTIAQHAAWHPYSPQDKRQKPTQASKIFTTQTEQALRTLPRCDRNRSPPPYFLTIHMDGNLSSAPTDVLLC